MKKIFLSILIFGCSILLQAQTTVTLRPGSTGKNAHIDNLNPNTANPGYIYINAGYNTVGGTATLSHDFIQFDLSSLPAGAVVQSAKISLFHATGGNHSTSTNNYEMLDMALSAWNADSITWNNQPGLSATDTVQIGNTTTTSDSKLNIDITSFVRAWVNNPALNFGMAMLLVNEPGTIGNFQTYGSCYNTDSTTWPELVVTYSGCSAQTVLQPGATGMDAHIDNLYPDNSNAGYTFINAGYNTVGGTPTLSHDFIQFDLSSIPVNATISSAALSLFNAPGDNSSVSTANYEMFAKALSAWNRDSITWNNQPNLSTTDTIQIGNTLTTTDSKLNIDITRFVQYWVSNPSLNFGMALQLVTEPGTLGNFQSYGSCFNADSTTWPKLVINWASCVAGIKEAAEDMQQFSIFPNPTNSVLNIRSAQNEPVDICVFDITGNKVINAYKANSIETSTLQAGLYFLQIQTKEGYITKKFVKN